MAVHQASFEVRTGGRGFTDVTARVQEVVRRSGIRTGLCVVFCSHTSASLVIQENYDPKVRADLLAWLSRTVPDGDPRYTHVDEGPDDMPSHIRAAITKSSESVPIGGGALLLGTWQAIYLLEHRLAGHSRSLVVHVTGE